MTLGAGTRLGPYEIGAPLGAGGMGEVYKARDTRLERTVAVKVLPSHLSSSEEVRQRFEREAKTISQLSHPHICALYDVGNQDGVEYLVMEYLEGETLADRLAKGPVPLEQALRYGVEMCDALDRAHRQGIVHRDLKPGNVMLTRSGVKLLDFGLAKVIAKAAAPSGVTALPTLVGSSPLTQEGTILGTFQYMAPEQLEGKDADARTDIFAFGCVLYEMASGRKAFSGASQASLISAIMSSEPAPVSTVQATSPPALDRVVKTCLAKDPDDRWQNAGDVGKELRWIAESTRGGAGAPVATARKSRREWIAWLLAGLLALGVLYLGRDLLSLRRDHPQPVHSFLVPPDGAAFRFSGDEGAPIVLSPDGERAVFGAGDTLSVLSLRSGALAALGATDGAKFPFWSPNSKSVGFFSQGKLKVIEATGGPVLTVCDAANARGGAWGADGMIVFAPDIRTGLFRVSAAGGTPVPVTGVDALRHSTHRWPFFLPDGKHFLYLAANHLKPRSDQAGIYVGSVDGKKTRRLLSAFGSPQYASGWLLLIRDSSLIGQRFDPVSFRFSGEPVRIEDDVSYDAGVWRGTFTASQNGVLAFQHGRSGAGGQLTWVDSAGRGVEKVGERSEAYGMRLSPDGRHASVVLGDPNNDVWVYDLTRGVRTRLTKDAQVILAPQWSPDSSEILFASQRAPDQFVLATVYANGAAEQKVVYTSKERMEPTDWSRDGRHVLVEKGNIGAAQIWAIPLADPAAAFALTQASNESNGQFSPDGRWVAFTSRETGRAEVYVTPLSKGGAHWQVSLRGGTQPRWSPHGQELYYLSTQGELMAASVAAAGSVFEIKNVRPLFRVNMFTGPRLGAFGYDVGADGNRFLVNAGSETGDTRVALVTHWDADLPR